MFSRGRDFPRPENRKIDMSYSSNELKILTSAARILERQAKQDALANRCLLTSPSKVRKLVQYRVAASEHEVFGVMYLNNQNGLLKIEDMFRGSINTASVYPREVVKSALVENAAGTIFFHNHPSGSSEPSPSDIQMTQILKDALSLVQIRVLDHLVVTAGGVVSFAELGLL